MASSSGVKAKKQALLAALRRTLGVVTPACDLVGCNRDTYYEYYNNDADFRAAVDALAEVQLDFGESKFLELINNGDTAATLHYIKTKGRKRGYGDVKNEPPPTPEGSGRKLVVMSLRKRNQQPPPPEPEPPTNLPAVI